MKTNYTPGPWHVTTAMSGKRAIAQSEDLYSIAIIEQWRGEESEANARIIASAPNGFNLAQHILAMKDDAHFSEHPEWQSIIEEAEAIMQKVSGKKEVAS